MSTRSKEQSPRAAPAHAGLPHFKNPNTNWPFLYSVREGFVLVNMAPRETTKQRLNKMEEAKW